MSLLNEASGTPSQLAGGLAAGIGIISSNQSIAFRQYTKSTLPTDGFVFWVANGGSQSFTGSLHYATEQAQNEDETVGINRVIFTATEEISVFNTVASNSLWVGTATGSGGDIQIAFSSRGSFYQQAGLWHYAGIAVYPALASQLVNALSDLPAEPVVSNSLPIWLSQNAMFPVYPSFLVPDNLVPPYIVAHIEPDQTEALGAFPVIGPQGRKTAFDTYQYSASQLLIDHVKLTMYGLNSQQAVQYLMSLMDYSRNTDAFGFCNSPVIRDEKRIQAEITVLAMKKNIVIRASYYLSTADAVARNMILAASCSISL